MAVDKEAICLSRVYSYYPKCNFPVSLGKHHSTFINEHNIHLSAYIHTIDHTKHCTIIMPTFKYILKSRTSFSFIGLDSHCRWFLRNIPNAFPPIATAPCTALHRPPASGSPKVSITMCQTSISMISSQEIHICVRFAKYRMLRLQPSAAPESSVWKLWQTGYHTLSVLLADAADPGELGFNWVFFSIKTSYFAHISENKT